MYALVDADILVHRIAFAAEETHYGYIDNKGREIWPTDVTTKEDLCKFLEENLITIASSQYIKRIATLPQDDVNFIIHAVLKKLEKDLKDIGATKIRYYMTSPNSESHNFRFKIKSPFIYKDKRKEKPAHHEYVFNYLCSVLNPLNLAKGYEADDAITMAAEKIRSKGKDFVIVSRDKDLKQIPCKYFDIHTRELEEISQNEADKNYWRQVVIGDWQTDNIPGLYQWSNKSVQKKLVKKHYKKRLEKRLKRCKSSRQMERYVRLLYKACGLSEKEMNITKLYVTLLKEA